MLLHGYNSNDGSFTGTTSFSNLKMEEAQAQNSDSIVVEDFTFIEEHDLYKSDGITFSLIDGWETIKAKREEEKAAINLERAKRAKIAAIDNQTSLDIIAIAGSANTQRNYMASYLKTVSDGGDVTSYFDLWSQVESLRIYGNDKEAQCQAAKDMAELEKI